MATNEQTRTKKASAMEALAVHKELYDKSAEGAVASLIQKNVALRRRSQLSTTFGACSWWKSSRS